MSPKVLVADDNADVRRGLAQLLESAGYEVIVAATSFAAKESFGEERPSIALFDRRMPGMDGLALSRHVRASGGPYCYVIVVSGYADTTSTLEAFEAGADDVVSKPWSSAELLARVRAGERLLAVAGGPATLQSALAEALQGQGGEVAVRAGDAVGRIFVHRGKIAWIQLTPDDESLFSLLRARVDVTRDDWRALVEDCSTSRASIGDAAVRRGVADGQTVAACVRDLVARRLERIVRMGGTALYLPDARGYEGVAFDLAELGHPEERPATSPRPRQTLTRARTNPPDARTAVGEILMVPGVKAAAVIDVDSGNVVGRTRDDGGLHDVDPEIVQSFGRGLRSLARGDAAEELLCCVGGVWHALLRLDPGDARCLYVALSEDEATLGGVRAKMRQVVGGWQAGGGLGAKG